MALAGETCNPPLAVDEFIGMSEFAIASRERGGNVGVGLVAVDDGVAVRYHVTGSAGRREFWRSSIASAPVVDLILVVVGVAAGVVLVEPSDVAGLVVVLPVLL